MNIIQKRHILDSVWHYRLDTEKNDIRFLLGLELKGKTKDRTISLRKLSPVFMVPPRAGPL